MIPQVAHQLHWKIHPLPRWALWILGRDNYCLTESLEKRPKERDAYIKKRIILVIWISQNRTEKNDTAKWLCTAECNQNKGSLLW